VLEFLSQVTPVEWAVIGLATSTCLLGALLPTIGNLLGRLFLGEDPLLARWAHARVERKAQLIAARNAKRAARKAARLAKQARD
jgi:hypothetical protein